MASAEINLKTFQDLSDFLQTNNDTLTEPPKQGAFKLFSFPAAPKNQYDLVFDGTYLGNASAAQNLQVLKSLGVTHVVNASQGTKFNQVNTDADFYKDAAITFHGIKALDIMTFKILPHLRPAAEFIHQARQANGVVYMHCLMGVSRSATVVLAYLMLHRDMSLMSAVHPELEGCQDHDQGRLSQTSTIMRGKNENWKQSVLQYRTW